MVAQLEEHSPMQASISDVPALLKLAKQFHSMSSWRDRPFKREAMRETLINIIRNPNGVLFYNGTGMIAGFVSPIYFGGGMVAQELFWFAEKNGRELLDAFEVWANKVGADGVLMVNLALDERTDRIMNAMYERRGYSLRERHYWKEL
jgi:hypothetical protein